MIKKKWNPQVINIYLIEKEIIENCLNQGYKLVETANTLNRDPRGIKTKSIIKDKYLIKVPKVICVEHLISVKK